MKRKLLIGIFAFTVLFFGVIAFIYGSNKKTSGEKKINIYPGYQLELPKEDDEIAVVKTNFGEFKIRFFPECAPKAVENFKKLSEKGYYNENIFHRVISNFMIQSGDPTATGSGGESIWGKDFEDEFSENLFNITGAVSMANRGKNTNSSQFFINFQESKNFKGWENFESAYKIYEKNPKAFKSRYGRTIDMSKVTDVVKDIYNKNGGNPFLDGFYSTSNEGHTVFGQVFDGIDTVEKISKVQVDKNDKPLQDIKIESIIITKFKGDK